MDLDLEANTSNMVPFANQLLANFQTDTSKKYLLTIAPQCPYPDAYDNVLMAGGVPFDIVWVQFYNNYCGTQSFVDGATTQNNL